MSYSIKGVCLKLFHSQLTHASLEVISNMYKILHTDTEHPMTPFDYNWQTRGEKLGVMNTMGDRVLVSSARRCRCLFIKDHRRRQVAGPGAGRRSYTGGGR